MDYATTYDFLQFQNDVWLHKTVSSTLTSGRFLICSPARSLEAKPFSVEYWKCKHRFLLDAVNQFGAASISLIISLYKWSFCAALAVFVTRSDWQRSKPACCFEDESYNTRFRADYPMLPVWIK